MPDDSPNLPSWLADGGSYPELLRRAHAAGCSPRAALVAMEGACQGPAAPLRRAWWDRRAAAWLSAEEAAALDLNDSARLRELEVHYLLA